MIQQMQYNAQWHNEGALAPDPSFKSSQKLLIEKKLLNSYSKLTSNELHK